MGRGIRPVPGASRRWSGTTAQGLGKGVKLERARRRAAGLPDLDDSLDVFHTLREGGRALRKTWGAATRALERADAAQKELRPAWPSGTIASGSWRAVEPALASGRAALGSSHGRRDGLETGQVGVRVLHPRRPPQRPGSGRGGRGGGAAAPGRRGVGQDPAVVAPPRELHVPGSSARTVGRVGVGPRRLVGVVGPGRSASPALATVGRHTGV